MKTLKGTVGALAGVAAVTLSARASFVDLLVVDITDNTLGLSEYALYGRFDNPSDMVSGVTDADISSTTPFFHNTINGAGQSALPFTSAQDALSEHPDADSFVTIGLFTGDGNETCIIPQFFDFNGFLSGSILRSDSSWFNCNPLNGAGVAGNDLLVLLAVFTPLNELDGSPGVVSGMLKVGYGTPDLPGVQHAEASFITPAPGALGLLALAGMMGPRRRRRS